MRRVASRSTHRERGSAIDDNGLSGHAVRPAVGDSHLCNVIDASRTSQDCLGADRLLHCLRHPRGHTCSLNQSRRDAIHGHVGRQRDCQTVREMDQCRFAGRVSDAAAARGKSGERRNVDDPAGFMPPEFQCERAGEEKWSAKVRLEHAVPDVRCQRVEITERDAYVPRRVVDEDIDPSEMADYFFYAAVDRFGVALIELHGVAPPAGRPDRFDRRASATGIAYIRNGNVRAGAGKGRRNCFSDVARTPCDERRFSNEIHLVPQMRTSIDLPRRSIIVSARSATAKITTPAQCFSRVVSAADHLRLRPPRPCGVPLRGQVFRQFQSAPPRDIAGGSARRATTSDLRKLVSSPRNKNISLYPNSEQGYIHIHPVPLRGALHDRSRTWDGWRWTPVVPKTNGARAYGEDVWS
jgi:hypothetical protein